MKLINYKKILSTTFISLTGVVQLVAEIKPPMPMEGGFDEGTVVGGPIDNYLPLLFFMAMVLGIWVINRSKKTSII